MPQTARLVARSNGIRYSRTRMTYNAGPNAVSLWLRKNGDPRNGVDDPIDWTELIPFQETRTYVQRVLSNLQVFRNRLEPGRMAVTVDRDLRREVRLPSPSWSAPGSGCKPAQRQTPATAVRFKPSTPSHLLVVLKSSPLVSS